MSAKQMTCNFSTEMQAIKEKLMARHDGIPCNLSTQETWAGGIGVPGQSSLYSKIWTQKKRQDNRYMIRNSVSRHV